MRRAKHAQAANENPRDSVRRVAERRDARRRGRRSAPRAFLADHDEAAFEELVARHGPMVLGICRRWLDNAHDIDDAFQATFLILLRKAGSLRDRDSLSN